MQYDEIGRLVTGSSPSDWTVLLEGPLYLDQLGEVSSGDRHWVEVDSHHTLAVYRPDVSLRLAWGLALEGDLTFEGMTWPDNRITRHVADAFWQGSLGTRWHYLVVDGGRCYLPDPEREYTRVGESPLDVEAGPWTAKASEIALARLLNELVQRPPGEFNRYMDQSSIVEVPD
jgi:hypothetical protein